MYQDAVALVCTNQDLASPPLWFTVRGRSEVLMEEDQLCGGPPLLIAAANHAVLMLIGGCCSMCTIEGAYQQCGSPVSVFLHVSIWEK